MNKNIGKKKNVVKEIQRILLSEWDPIGIQDIPEAVDEYDSYVFLIYELIGLKKSEGELFDYLWSIETRHMGLPGKKNHTKAIAHKLFLLET